jgi:hypothetical protein
MYYAVTYRGIILCTFNVFDRAVRFLAECRATRPMHAADYQLAPYQSNR